MSERSLWANLRKKMIPRYWKEATRHEDLTSAGIADVSFVQFIPLDDGEWTAAHGWMELKYVSQKPRRANTIVRVNHFTDAQRAWLMSKGMFAGNTFVLLQLERDYLLFDHIRAQQIGELNTKALYEHANWFSRGALNAEELHKAITDAEN